MMRRFAFVLLLAVPSPLRAATPLFDDFKALCVDTKARIEAVRQAVPEAGGTVTSDTVLDHPMPMTVMRWDHQVGDITLRGQVEWIEPQHPASEAGTRIASCRIEIPILDDASIARLRDWAGLKPVGDFKNLAAQGILYQWQELDGRHVPVQTGIEGRKEQREGHDWLFSIRRFEERGTTSVVLTNFLQEPR